MSKVRLNTKLISTLNTVLFRPASELISTTNIASTTWYNIMQKPDVITIKQLLAIANGLCIPVRRLFSTTQTDYIGNKDEYITYPYKECYYDADTLYAIVSDRPGITWKQAAKITNMSRQRLRDSLLAVRRTPTTRFLTVCEVFNIDPFTVLIDPNPEMRHSTNHCANSQQPAEKDSEVSVRADITNLYRQLEQLSNTVSVLTEKYQKLLADHERLARRISANYEHATNRYSSIVAEPDPEK